MPVPAPAAEAPERTQPHIADRPAADQDRDPASGDPLRASPEAGIAAAVGDGAAAHYIAETQHRRRRRFHRQENGR